MQKKWLPPAGQYFSTAYKSMAEHLGALARTSSSASEIVSWLSDTAAFCLARAKCRGREEAKPIIMQRETKGKSRRSRCDFPTPVTTYHAAPTETSKNAQSWRLRPFFFPCRDGLLIWRRQNRTKRWAFFFSCCSSAPQFHHLDTRHISWSGVETGPSVRL